MSITALHTSQVLHNTQIDSQQATHLIKADQLFEIPDDKCGLWLSSALEELQKLPTGKTIVKTLHGFLINGHQKILLEPPKIEDPKAPIELKADLQKEYPNSPYIRDLKRFLEANEKNPEPEPKKSPSPCYIIGAKDPKLGYQICRIHTPAHIALGHELIHLIDGLTLLKHGNVGKFIDQTQKRTLQD